MSIVIPNPAAAVTGVIVQSTLLDHARERAWDEVLATGRPYYLRYPRDNDNDVKVQSNGEGVLKVEPAARQVHVVVNGKQGELLHQPGKVLTIPRTGFPWNSRARYWMTNLLSRH